MYFKINATSLLLKENSPCWHETCNNYNTLILKQQHKLQCNLHKLSVHVEVTVSCLLSWFQLHLDEFMCTFFKVQTGLNGEVDRAAKGHQVGLSWVYNYCRLLTFFTIWNTSTSTAAVTLVQIHTQQTKLRVCGLRVLHVAVWTNHIKLYPTLASEAPSFFSAVRPAASCSCWYLCTRCSQLRFLNILQACRPSKSSLQLPVTAT